MLAGDVARAALLAESAAVDAFVGAALARSSFSIRSELDRPFVVPWIATVASALVGVLLGWRVADELHVLDVAVRPEMRRSGVGRALVEGALRDAAGWGQRVAVLEVRRSNVAAIRLYRASGFVAVRLRRAYYEDTGEDAVEMACALAPGALADFEEIDLAGR